MFQVIGDTIYFHGQPLAVITMPLSGLKLEAVDALNQVDYYPGETVEDILKEVKADINHACEDTLTLAMDAVWLNEAQTDWIKGTLETNIDARLRQTWIAWSIAP